MRESIVPSPTAVASTRMTPFWFTVPPITPSPVRLSTGIDSPVIIASSSELWPSRTTPSTATFSPGRTTNTSPMTTCSIGTSTSAPSRITRADFAERPIRAEMADDAAPFERSSKYLPIVMNTSTAADTSKNMSYGLSNTTTQNPNAYAAVVPSAISTSMFGLKWRSEETLPL